VEGDRLDHPPGAGQPGIEPDEDEPGARAHEPVHEILSEPAVDLARRGRGPLPAVPARVVDIDVEPVLMRRVTRGAEASPEVSAPWPAEIPDSDSRRPRVATAVALEHVEHRAHEAIRAEAPPPGVRGRAMDVVPRIEETSLARKLNAPDEASGGGGPQGPGCSPPGAFEVRLGREPGLHGRPLGQSGPLARLRGGALVHLAAAHLEERGGGDGCSRDDHGESEPEEHDRAQNGAHPTGVVLSAGEALLHGESGAVVESGKMTR
jgi:hypothetical protein